MKNNQTESINVLIPNGVYNTRIYKKTYSQLRGYEIPRSDIKNMSDYPYLDKHSGIYFLFGENDLYIGKSNDLVKRINYHNKDSDKDFFDKCVVFTTENNTLTETYIDYLEYMYINKVNENSLYELKNSDLRHREPNITDFDMPTVEYIYNEILFYLSVMNYELYADNEQIVNEDIFVINSESRKKHNNTKIDAKCIFEGSQVEILQGSIGFITDNIENDEQKQRTLNEFKKHLELKNIEIIDDTYFKVINNIKFSPSLGACFILNIKSVNGWIEWTQKDNYIETLDSKYRSLKGDLD